MVDEAAGMLGTRDAVSGVRKILEDGTSADRQIKVWKDSGEDTKAVVDWLISETMAGFPTPKSASQPPR